MVEGKPKVCWERVPAHSLFVSCRINYMGKGLVILNTGNGKGKTTAALGLAFRAMGHKEKVCLIQFIKNKSTYGEIFSAERYIDMLDVFNVGNGFVFELGNIENSRIAAIKGWELAKKQLNSEKYFMVILDELTYLMTLGFIEIDSIIDCIKKRRENLHVVITGRYAPKKLIESADLVTEMQEIKHPYHFGVTAQKGIEF